MIKPLVLPPTKRAYIDVESDPTSTLVWLVGVHIEEENKSYSFFANTPNEEKQMLAKLLTFLDSKPDLNLLAYSRADETLLRKRLTAQGLPLHLLLRITDIYADIHNCVAFPIPGLTLKELAEFCGFHYRDSGMDGLRAAQMYGSGQLKLRTKNRLIKYNEDDLLAVKQLVEYVERQFARRFAAQAGAGSSGSQPSLL